MSSTISTVVMQSIPPKAITKLKMDEKQHRLVRTSSIEKIRRFNTYICSQQYYILPALLSWIKSPKGGLQLSTEKTIFLFRSLFFSSFLYRMFLLGYKTSKVCSIETFQGYLQHTTSGLISNFFKKFSKCFESTFLLAATVYSCCALVVIQLFVVFYLIVVSIIIPYGFVFLVGCMFTIKYLCYKTMFYSMTQCRKQNTKIKCNWLNLIYCILFVHSFVTYIKWNEYMRRYFNLTDGRF